MDYINIAINTVIKISKRIMIILMAVMVISMFLQVVTRYIFGTGIAWTEELARFSNVWLVFIGGSMLTFSDEHIKVTIFDGILNEKQMRVLQALRNIIFLVYSIIIIKVGLDSLNVVSRQTSPNMLIPMNYIYGVIPIGAVLMGIYLIFSFILGRGGE
jgi:TRAP-type C4-dicarboxylate transport system permease small subunit